MTDRVFQSTRQNDAILAKDLLVLNGAGSGEVDRLQAKIESLEVANMLLQAQLNDARTHVQRLQDNHNVATDRNTWAMRRQLDQARTAQRQAEETSNEIQARLCAELAVMKQQLAVGVENQLAGAAKEKEKSTAENAFLQRQNERLQEQMSSLQNSVVAAEKSLSQIKRDYEDEHQHRQDLQSRLVEIDRLNKGLEREKQELTMHLHKLQAEKEGMENLLQCRAGLETVNSSLKLELEQQQEALREREAVLEQYKRQSMLQQSELDHAKRAQLGGQVASRPRRNVVGFMHANFTAEAKGGCKVTTTDEDV